MMLLFVSLTLAKAQNPLITITTLDATNYEGSITFSLSGSEEDFKSVQIDAGYGKKPANHVNEKGEIPLKGNIVRVYGTCQGFVAPMDRVKNIAFAENTCLKQLSFVLNELPNGLDLTANKALEYVSFMSCGLQTLDFGKLPASLKQLYLSTNNLKEVNLSKLPQLHTVYIDDNPQIKSMDFSKNPHLYRINISGNPLITNVVLTANKELVVFEAWNCNLSHLDLSHSDLLESLSVKNNKIKDLKLGKTDKIEVLDISGNSIKEVHPELMPALQSLSIQSNTEINTLDVSQCPKLVILGVDTTKVSELNLTNFPKLEVLTASKSLLKELDLSKNPALNQVSIEDCGSFTHLDISNNPQMRLLIVTGNKLGFDTTQKIANQLADLTGSIEAGIWGVFLDKKPEDLNRVSQESVGIALKKGWEVVARNDKGKIFAYTGFGTHLEEVEQQPKGLLQISIEGNNIVISNLPQGHRKRVNIFAENGNFIASGLTNDSSIRFNDLEALQGVFLVECNGAVGKGFIR